MTLIFEHIFKTGGTSFLRSYLPAALPEAQRFELSGMPAKDRESLAALPAAKRRKLRVIAGHNAEVLRRDFPDARFISLVRDPVERAISAYLHAKHEPRAKVGGYVNGRDLSLAQFVAEDAFARRVGFASLHNGQARIILGPDYARLNYDDGDGIIARIRARYAAVGCTEQFALFLYHLHAAEGLPLCLFNNRRIRKQRTSFRPAPEEVALIRSHNRLDERLYELVEAHLNAGIEETWWAARNGDFAAYRAALEAYQEATNYDENASAPYRPRDPDAADPAALRAAS